MWGLKASRWRCSVLNVASSRTTGRYWKLCAEASSYKALSVISDVNLLPSGAFGITLIKRNGANIGFGKSSLDDLKHLTTEFSGLLSNSVDIEVGHHSHGR